MERTAQAVALTPQETTQTVLALRERIALLSRQEEEDPRGHELQEMLAAERLIDRLLSAHRVIAHVDERRVACA